MTNLRLRTMNRYPSDDPLTARVRARLSDELWHVQASLGSKMAEAERRRLGTVLREIGAENRGVQTGPRAEWRLIARPCAASNSNTITCMSPAWKRCGENWFCVRHDPSKVTAPDRAALWLRDVLAAGPRPSEAVKAQATAAGVSAYALTAAAQQIGVAFQTRSVAGTKGHQTFWSLPEEA